MKLNFNSEPAGKFDSGWLSINQSSLSIRVGFLHPGICSPLWGLGFEFPGMFLDSGATLLTPDPLTRRGYIYPTTLLWKLRHEHLNFFEVTCSCRELFLMTRKV